MATFGKNQEVHGGQDWKHCDNFVADFSVTLGTLGPPKSAVAAAKKVMDHIGHYPACDLQPCLSDLAEFCAPGASQEFEDRMVLGNGASEVIDLVIRCAPEGPFKPGQSLVQYREYQRSAKSKGRVVLDRLSEEKGAVLALINPCNPTGDFLDINDLKAYIEGEAQDNSAVVVDESMLFWYGPEWRSKSLMHQTAWIQGLATSRGVDVYVIASWTKIWCCAGIRIGSILCPTPEHAESLKKIQVPWSVNSPALAFTSAACKDTEYINKTWELTRPQRAAMVKTLEADFPTWKLSGEEWLSWVFIDTGSAAVAEAAYLECRKAGVPIRWGKFGYELDTCIRLRVYGEEVTSTLFEALAIARDVEA